MTLVNRESQPTQSSLPIESFRLSNLTPSINELGYEKTLIDERFRHRKRSFSSFFDFVSKGLRITPDGLESDINPPQIKSTGHLLAEYQDTPKNNQVVRRVWNDILGKDEELLKSTCLLWGLQNNIKADFVSLWLAHSHQKDYPEIRKKLKAFSRLFKDILFDQNGSNTDLIQSLSKDSENIDGDNFHLPHLTKTLLSRLYKTLNPQTKPDDKVLIDFAKQEGVLDIVAALEKTILLKQLTDHSQALRKLASPQELYDQYPWRQTFVQGADDFSNRVLMFFLDKPLENNFRIYNPGTYPKNNGISGERLTINNLTSTLMLMETELWFRQNIPESETKKVKIVIKENQKGNQEFFFVDLPAELDRFSEKPAVVALNNDEGKNPGIIVQIFPYRPYPSYPYPRIGVAFAKDTKKEPVGYIGTEEMNLTE